LTKETVLQIINEENFSHYNFFNEHDISPEEVVIAKEKNEWVVYTTDERAATYGTKKIFSSESEALENFIKRLQAGKAYRELLNKVGK
jgi:hypothetical protein